MGTVQKATTVWPPSIRTFWQTRIGSQTADNVEAKGLGRLPALSVVMALGLLMVALAYNGGREGAPWSEALRWIGLLVVFAPSAVRLCSPTVGRQERIGLLVAIGLALCLVRVLYSPLEFQFGDELRHWRSTQDIFESGHLFQYNPSLSIKPFYPGLQNVTVALVSLGGLTTFGAGVIVIVAARLVLVIALYLFYEQASGSSYVAGIASLLYMTNPHYQSFTAMYVYESLALPIAALVLFSVAREAQMTGGNRISMKLISLFGLAAVTVTHHFTSYVLLAFFVLWTIAAMYVRRRKPGVLVPAGKMILAFVMIVVWIAFVAPATLDYFAAPLSETARDLINVVTGNQSVSNVFRAPANPLQEQLISIGTIGLISVMILLGIWQVWRRYRDNPLALAMAFGSIGYFAILVIRVASSQGSEWAGRSWPFVFVVVAFVVAVGGVELWKSQRQVWLPRVVFPAIAITLFLGGLMSGWPPYWGRLPGPYLAGADERSVSREGVAAAEWAGAALGHGNRVAADAANQDLMAAYGAQVPVQGLSWVFLSSSFGAKERTDVRLKDARYLVVDQRLSQSLPATGTYFESGEPDAYRHTKPIAPSALAKFDGFAEIGRIFDSGDVKIYDVGAASHVP